MKKQNVRLPAARRVTDTETGTVRATRINQVDILKGLAIISVILIHVFPDVVFSMTGAPFYYWQAVPVFLLLAAFTGSLAYRAQRRENLAALYDPAVLIRRYSRILGPYTFIWVLQIGLVLVFLPANLPPDAFQSLVSGVMNLLVIFLTGGFGPGNYFVPIILEQILIIPLLYWIAVRYSPGRMLALAFGVNILLEAFSVMTGLPPGVYAISPIPYFMAAACGVWLVFQKREISPWMLAAGMASGAYIAAVYYFSFHVWFINSANGFFTVFSYFWTLLIVVAGLRYLPSQSMTLLSKVLRELGKASWHIFLVQMTFFFLFRGLLAGVIDLAVPGTGPFRSFLCLTILTIPSLGICLASGYGFYRAEEKIKGIGMKHTPRRSPKS